MLSVQPKISTERPRDIAVAILLCINDIRHTEFAIGSSQCQTVTICHGFIPERET